MKTKTIVRVVLLAFVAVSMGWLFFSRSQGSINEKEPGAAPAVGNTASALDSGKNTKPDRVVVYYFHTTARCPTCHKIENYTREAVETGFAPALKDGSLEFHAVNIEEKGNEHYIKDYQLHTKSVVVSKINDGKEERWKNLTQVWELTHDKEAFFKYIQDEVNLYFKEE